MEEFGITSQLQAVLPISIYLVGYVGGPLLFGPLSEQYGRQKLVIATFILFILFTLACALTPSWNALIGFRFLAGVAASAPIAIVGGTYADIYDDPTTRGLAMAIFMAATSMGPLFSPILSGYITPALGWRWTFWIGLIIAGACLPPMFLIPETYAPILLTRRAAKLRKETGNPNIFSAHELEDQDWKHVATVTLTRPVRMILFELIVGATCLYLAIAYAIFYMTFSSYPLIFQKLYGQGPGFAGFMFLPIGLGELLALPIFIWYDGYLLRAKSRPDPPAWTKKEEYRRLPLACLGGPLYVVSIFWLGWSARTDVHWVVPMLSGLIFGLAYELIFMAMLNYLTDAYEIFAASAMAAASCARSIFGAVLPLATTPMFQRLGIAWACSLLAFLSLAMCVVPFGFLHYGVYIRSRSKFCIYLKERKEKEEEERQRSRNQSRSSLPGLGVGAGGHEKA
jgi:multidrug resistance protein